MTGTVNSPTAEETTREDIPLKTGAKLSKWYNCSEECLGGSKFINVAFGTLTVIITIALIIQIYYGDYQVVPHGSVATDSLECSRIGTQILKQGGKAVDAAIASAFCLAVAAPHLTSLDAEGQILIYNHKTRSLPTVIEFSSTNVLSDKVPRLVLGLAYIHQKFGTVPWKTLVEPSVALARNGLVVSKMLAQAVTRTKTVSFYERLEPGQYLHLEVLSNTLTLIGNIKESDLYSYIDSANQPVLSEGIKSTFHNYDVFVPSVETVGPVLLVNLREIEDYNFTEINAETTKKIIQTTLKTYEEFNVTEKFHEGTSTNIAVMDMDDNYVSMVVGLYGLFGSGEMTSHEYGLDVKNKRRRCSRIPLILTDRKYICGKRMVLGANGIAQASQIVSNLVIGDRNATDGIEAPRFYIMENRTVALEANHAPSFPSAVTQYLKDTYNGFIWMPEPYYSSNIVEKAKDDLSSHSDSRGGGIASRF